jgi:DNA polymerase III alpha subunit (gram-positive type)
VVASCFKHPFSRAEGKPTISDIKRPIILVGHDVGADINYLRAVGYDIYNLSNLQEIIDTASMWRYVKRDTNSRNLGSILAELDLIGWNLHNAGNDAAYTLQAMVRIAIRDLKERQGVKVVKDMKDHEIKERSTESVREVCFPHPRVVMPLRWRRGEEKSPMGL